MTIYIHCDGSCYNHPDHNTVGYAAVMSKKFDPEMTEVIRTKTGWCEEGTNNTAEWLALLAGMEMMIEHYAEFPREDVQYQIYTDSALVVGQANGTMKVRKDQLKYYYTEYRDLEQKAHDIWFDIKWTSRQNNRAADAYSKLVNPYFKEKIKNELSTRQTKTGRPSRCPTRKTTNRSLPCTGVQRESTGRSG